MYRLLSLPFPCRPSQSEELMLRPPNLKFIHGAAEGPERSPRSETPDSITFVLAVIFLLRFQPRNRMSSPQMTHPFSMQQDTRGMFPPLNPLYWI
jgi:hypothetical protein